MLTIAAHAPVIEMHQTYRYTADGEPLPAGEQLCRLTVHSSPIDGRLVLVDVPTDRAIPDGWRLASRAEVAALTGRTPLMSTVQDVPTTATLDLPGIADTQVIPLIGADDRPTTEQLDGLAADLTRLLATEGAPVPDPTAARPTPDTCAIADLCGWPECEAEANISCRHRLDDALDAPGEAEAADQEPAGRTDRDLQIIDVLFQLGGSVLAAATQLSLNEGLPIGVLSGDAGEPRMVIEVTEGSDLARRAEVDRIAKLLRVEAAADYLDVELHAVYSAQRRYGGWFTYRVEAVLPAPPIAAAARAQVVEPAAPVVGAELVPCDVEVIVAELVDEDDAANTVVEIDRRLAVPVAGVPAPHQLAGCHR